MKIMRPFTVVGMYEDSGEAFVEWIQEATPKDAVKKVLATCNPSLIILSVFHGHHKDMWCNVEEVIECG